MKKDKRLLIIIKASGVKVNNDIRCFSCGKKLAEGQIKDGNISIQCKCGVLNLITATPEKKIKLPAPEKVEYPTDWNARMIVQTFAGWIGADTILQHENIGAWALGWLNRAQKSEAQGKTLVVFEVPRKTSVKFIEELEAHTVGSVLNWQTSG